MKRFQIEYSFTSIKWLLGALIQKIKPAFTGNYRIENGDKPQFSTQLEDSDTKTKTKGFFVENSFTS